MFQRPPSYAGGLHHTPSNASHRPPPQRHSIPQYGSQAYRGPPPGADPQLWQWFSAVDVDGSGSIDVSELQTALVNGA